VTILNPATGSTSSSATFTITPSFTLTVVRSGNGTVTSDRGGIACGSSCTATYSSATSVILTASPGSKNQHFVGWTGGCSGVDGPQCTLTVTANTTVGASFKGGK
jgi:hypothetical protein